ncbi:hypothetical protein RR48_14272 [Papilio machaon]|uniref:Uncharacterized protein n=1 Tax=Papilio machaon TaxID=76193 RepID=A0A194QLV1_PAPMA|nr:hypothetical protein RR48_14272 [Papilio machaon]
MECGRLSSGLSWNGHSFTTSNPSIPSVVIEDCCSEQWKDETVNDNYYISYPEDESDLKVSIANDPKVNIDICNYPRTSAEEILNGEISEDRDAIELMKGEAKKLKDYKLYEAVNDFDIELEGGEAVPIVYVATTRAARLQRALRLAGLKKVCLLLFSTKY